MKILGMVFFLSACAAAKIPPYRGPLYTLDNRDPQKVVLRYEYSKDVLRDTDEKAKGMLCFKPEDFATFTEIYVVPPSSASESP